jgi:tryptophanase
VAVNKRIKTDSHLDYVINIIRKVVAQENALRHWCGTLEFAASMFKNVPVRTF